MNLGLTNPLNHECIIQLVLILLFSALPCTPGQQVSINNPCVSTNIFLYAENKVNMVNMGNKVNIVNMVKPGAAGKPAATRTN